MSTPRFKKDKEIIAEYESQVKGKGESLQMCRSKIIAHIGIMYFCKLACDPSVVYNSHISFFLSLLIQYHYTLGLWNDLQINFCWMFFM